MTNLFSIFDTNTNTMLESNWISSFFIIMLLPQFYWIYPSKLIILFDKLFFLLHKEIKILLSNKFNMIHSIFLISLFFFIFFNNIMGLFPYIFTSSSHMIFSVSLSMPMWLSLFIFSYSKNLNFMFSHMIPQGTPSMLMPFMVLIETISNIIRPLTLCIRLTANMIAGHLLLTLMSSMASPPSPYITLSIIITQTMLLILEFSVSIIQAYVFMILIALYIKESN